MSGTLEGVPLAIDKKLHDTLCDQRVRAEGPIIVSGPRFSGKTTAIQRTLESLLKEGLVKDINAFVHHQIPNEDLHGHIGLCETIQSIIKSKKPDQIIEGTPYTITYVLSGEYQTDYDLKKKKRDLVKQIKEKWAKKFKENLHLHRKQEEYDSHKNLVNFLIEPDSELQKIENDANKVFMYFLDRAKARLSNDQIAKIMAWKDKIIQLSTYDERHLVSRKKTKGFHYLILPLIEKYIDDFKDKDENLVSIQIEKETDSARYLFTFFGLSLFAVGEKESAKKALPAVADVVAAGCAAAFGSIAGVVLTGISAIFGYSWERMEASIRPYMKAYRAWNYLPDEKKKAMCSRMDEKFHLPPNSSFEFFSGWLGKKEFDQNELLKELKKINLEKLREIIEKHQELKQTVDALRDEIDQLKIDFLELEKWVRQEIEEIKLLGPEQRISCLRVNLRAVQNKEEILAIIANTNIKIDNTKIPFVPFNQVDHHLRLFIDVSKGVGLFVIGNSGSGKSRLLFEAINTADMLLILGEQTTLERIKNAVKEAGGEASDVSNSNLTDALKQAKGAYSLVWDSFPEGLENAENFSLAKTALERISSIGNVRVAISLNPRFYAKYFDIAEDIVGLDTISVSYTKEEFANMFRTIGNLHLRKDYESIVGEHEMEIIEILYDKWGLPKHIDKYFADLRQRNEDAVSLAKKIKDESYERYANHQLKQLGCRGASLDFLYSIKLAKLFGEDNKEEALEKLQSEIFGTKGESRLLGPWFRRYSGRCFMHDSDLEALALDANARRKIFTYIGKEGFKSFLKRKLLRLDGSGWLKLGEFLAENSAFFVFQDLLTATARTQRKFWDKDIWHEKYFPFINFVIGIGFKLELLTLHDRNQVFDFALKHNRFSYALGRGIGHSFQEMQNEAKTHVIDYAATNLWFRDGFVKSLASYFDQIDSAWRLRIFDLLRKDGLSQEDFGWKVGESCHKFEGETAKQMLDFAFGHWRFFKALCIFNSLHFESLSEENMKNLLESAIRHEDRDYSYWLGSQIGERFFLMPPRTREILWVYAMKNGDFAKNLGWGFGIMLEKEYVSPECLREIKSLAESNKDFAWGLVFGGSSPTPAVREIKESISQSLK